MYSQPGIYNVLDYGMQPGYSGTVNAAGLQLAIDTAQSGGGGIVLIPANYYGTTIYDLAPLVVGAPVVSVSSGPQISIVGTGEGTILNIVQAADFLYATSLSGVTIQDLTIEYDTTGEPLTGTALTLNESSEISLFRVYLLNCQYGVKLIDCNQARLTQCNITYGDSFALSSATAVEITGTTGGGGSEIVALDQCQLSFGALLTSSSNVTGLLLEFTESISCLQTVVSGFSTGIQVSPGSGESVNTTYFSDVVAEGAAVNSTLGAALVVQPSDGGTVQDISFVDCEFAQSEPQSPPVGTYGNGGAYISAGDPLAGDSVNGVRLVSCSAIGWSGPGLQIESASNIEILGGSFSSNGQATGTTSAGIALVPAEATHLVAGVRIVGASCRGAVYGDTAQVYGIFVASGVVSAFVRNCDLTGNTTSLNFVAGATLEVTDCTGYNDSTVPLATAVPPSGTSIDNLYFQYYGPLTFCVAHGNSVTIAIDGHPIGLQSGCFTLMPGEGAVISYMALPPPIPSFLALRC